MATTWATAIVLVCFALAIAIVLLLVAGGQDLIGKVRQQLHDRAVAAQATAARAFPPDTAPPAPPLSYEPADWITIDDYPPSAIRAEEQGTVKIRWTVNAEGRAVRCVVIASSGHESLDSAACRAILRSVRYRPAANLAGRSFERRITWRLPEE